MTFEEAIKKFAEKTTKNMLTVGKHTKQQIFMQIIEENRVDTGLMRGNWQTTALAPSNKSLIRYEAPGSMGTGHPAINEMLRNIRGATVNYMTNNVEYGPKIEGMYGTVAKNVDRFQRTVRELAESVR